MQIKSVLKQLGLNERHGTIYLACLGLGTASIQKISLKSGFARSTCESVLKSLQEKGFVTSFKKKSTRVYSPEDPKKLVLISKAKTKLLEDSLPEFSARYFRGNILPTVRLYQGEAGAESVLQEVLDEAKELRSFGSIDDIFKVIGDYFNKFIETRIKRGIPLKTILHDTPLAKERQRTGPQQLREVRLAPAHYSYSSLTFIWNEKVAMFSFNDGVTALVIESKEMAQIQGGMFDLIWDTLGN